MVSNSGWQKLDDCQWRHDGVSVNNLMNIYVDDGTRDNHASSSTGSEYKITYRNTNSEFGEKSIHVLRSGISNLKEAKRIANSIREDNPSSIPDDF